MTSHQAGKGRHARASVDVPASKTIVGAHGGPTVPRIALGAQLRRLREASNLTTAEAARVIRATHSKISRLERGRTSARQRDVADLLTLYGVTDEAEREKMLALARQGGASGWWHQYSDVLPRWLELYLGLERAASLIRAYEVQFIHGLMQTEDYARAVILISNADAPAGEVDRRVSLRMQRQDLLTQPDAPDLWVVLDEAALRRSPDDRAVMRAQLKHLLELTDLPNVTLQVVPFRVGTPAAVGGPFTILRFRERDLPDVVYLEQLSSALYLDQTSDVQGYLAVIDRLCIQAATGGASKDMLRSLLKEE
jgi:transcriptional regulator with XRE-family HTH domain